MNKKRSDSSLWPISYHMSNGQQRMNRHIRAIMNNNDGDMHGSNRKELDTLT